MRTTRGFEVAGIDGDTVTLGSSELQRLDSSIEGRLLRDGDEGFDESTVIWNAGAAARPALVAQPASARDVAELVGFATHHGVLMSVKGGGHHIAGTCVAEQGLMLDMARMRGVQVDPEARTAQVAAGCLLRDVDAATQRHGLATTLGFISEVGVAGLTLGGGFGYLARRLGWAVDNLREVEIVTADGEVRVANHEREPDLHWAVRGAGANFGVVTRFTFDLHEVGPEITGGLILWDADRADDVLETYRQLTAVAPRELTAAVMIRLAPPAPFIPAERHFTPVVGMLVCHTGARPQPELDAIRGIGEPIADLISSKPYVAQQSMLDDTEPKGLCQYWKTEYLADLPEAYLPVFRDAALDVASPMSYSVIFHIGGALNDRSHDDGAVGNRDARFVSGFSGVWPPNDNGRDIVAAVRAGWEKIRPFSTGSSYVNFQGSDEDDTRTAAAYAANLDRLRRVKADYDPANVFRRNRNIAPAQ